MTTENLIPRPEETIQDDQQNPTPTAELESQPSVETTETTNLMSGADTSTKGTDWEKRYKDLQSFQSKRENDLRGQIKDLETAETSIKAPITADEMEELKEKHPETYNMMLTVAQQTTSEANKGINAQLQTIEEERMMTEFTEAQTKIQAAHPDYIEVVNSEVFQAWAQNESAQVQQWIYDNPNDPDLAIIALDRYKAYQEAAKVLAEQTAHLEMEAQQTQADTNNAAQAIGASSAPATKEGQKIWTKTEIKTMSSTDWSKHSEDIEKAYTEGRVNFNA